MNFIKKIYLFIKQIFNKKEDIKMLNQPIKKDLNGNYYLHSSLVGTNITKSSQ